MKISELNPAEVFKAFEAISAIPRESGNEEAVINFIAERASELGLTYQVDQIGNLLVLVPASSGWEETPLICLQSHVDMVCEKIAGSQHDFSTDPIELMVLDGFLGANGPDNSRRIKANGTTLGADNGIGVAMMIALMSVEDPHGPLELLFTVDEEVGFTGVNNLGFELASRLFINLDGEEEKAIYVGCAGFTKVSGRLNLNSEPALVNLSNIENPKIMTIYVSGLTSGHSGLEIHRNRGNAIKLVAMLLRRLGQETTVQICSNNNDGKDNVIPATCAVRFILPEQAEPWQYVQSIGAVLGRELRQDLPPEEQKFDFIMEKDAPEQETCFSKDDSERIVNALISAPHGVWAMHPDLPVVATSSNLAKISTDEAGVNVLISVRSCFGDILNHFAEEIAKDLKERGFDTALDGMAPAWQPDLHSSLLNKSTMAYYLCYGADPKLKVVHAGLECAAIAQQYPDMEIISIGPDIHDVHSSNEWVDVKSVGRCWDFVLGLLQSF